MMLEKIRAMEDEIFKLKGELSKTHDRIAVLEKSTSHRECSCQSNRDSTMEMQNRIINIQRQYHELHEKCDKLTTLQHLLNGFILTTQRKLQTELQSQSQKPSGRNNHNSEDNVSDSDAEELYYLAEEGDVQEVVNIQARIDSDLVNVEESLRVDFYKNQDLIRDSKLPLNSKDLITFAALENFLKLSNRPAEKMCEGSWQQQRNEKLLDLQYICSNKREAVANYNSLVASMDHRDESKFFMCWHYDKKIVAISRERIRLLDEMYKEETHSWPMDAIRHFYTKDWNCVLELENKTQIPLYSLEKQEIFDAIYSVRRM